MGNSSIFNFMFPDISVNKPVAVDKPVLPQRVDANTDFHSISWLRSTLILLRVDWNLPQ